MPKYYTTAEVADILKIKERRVSDYVKQGRLKGISLTGKVTAQRGNRAFRIPEEALDAFIKENEVIS